MLLASSHLQELDALLLSRPRQGRHATDAQGRFAEVRLVERWEQDRLRTEAELAVTFAGMIRGRGRGRQVGRSRDDEQRCGAWVRLAIFRCGTAVPAVMVTTA